MSRSFRKTPIRSWGRTSEKEDKRNYNRSLRRINRVLLSDWGEDADYKEKNQVMDVWSMAKDGKVRFDPKEFPKQMRK